MQQRPWVTDVGRRLAKVVVLVVVFITLAGFTMLSHLFSNARAGRILCVANQRAMQEAIEMYQTENGGNNPEAMEAIRPFYTSPSHSLGRCPASTKAAYSYDPGSGIFRCPNPAHTTGL